MANFVSESTPKYKISRRFEIWFLILSSLLVMGFVGHLVISIYPPLWAVKKIAKIDFPKSAKLLYSHGRFFLEVDVWAKIEIDNGDVDSFIKSLPPSKPVTDSDRVRVLKWLEPDYLKNPNIYNSEFSLRSKLETQKSKYICLQKTEGDIIERHEIVIKLDNPKKATIYLWYSSF